MLSYIVIARAAAARRTSARGEGERMANVVFGNVGPRREFTNTHTYIYIYAQINILTVISERGPLVCAGDCIIQYYYIVVSPERRSLPRYIRSPFLRAFCEPPPPPTFPAARVAHDNHVVHALARGCVCPQPVWVMGGGGDTEIVFARGERAYYVLKNRFYFVLNEYNSAL